MIAEQWQVGDLPTLFDDHLFLRQSIDQLRTILAERQATPLTVASMIAELTEHVLEHFDFEEDGGYFAEALGLAPYLEACADVLLRQHPKLAEQLAELEQLATRGAPSEFWWSELNEKFALFLTSFTEHEQAEDWLLLKAYTEDIGAAD